MIKEKIIRKKIERKSFWEQRAIKEAKWDNTPTGNRNICKKEKIDVLLAVGGGSVIDCTKAIAAATFYEGDAWDIVTKKSTCN